MKTLLKTWSIPLAAALLISSATVMASDKDREREKDRGNKSYDVTITNITHGQIFTPILVASHKKGHPLFTLGKEASDELARVAEGGDTVPLATYLTTNGIAYETASSGALLEPGKSVTVRISTRARFNYISVVSMLIPTNDAFFALNGIKAPEKSLRVLARTYDAGSELNDEQCVHMPGPFCQGEGYNQNVGEGFVHVHPGISGAGDLTSGEFSWNNPTAKIVIKRVK